MPIKDLKTVVTQTLKKAKKHIDKIAKIYKVINLEVSLTDFEDLVVLIQSAYSANFQSISYLQTRNLSILYHLTNKSVI